MQRSQEEICQTFDIFNIEGLEKNIIEKTYAIRAYIRNESSRFQVLFVKIKVMWISIDQLNDE